MNMIKSFFKFSFGSVVAAGISFFTTPIITLFILPEELGRVAIFLVTNSILIQIVLAGTDQGFMRFFYEKDAKEKSVLLWNSILPSFFIWGILSLGILSFWKMISKWLIADIQFLVVALLSVYLLLSLIDRYAFLVVRMQQKGIIFSVLRILTSVLNAAFLITYCKYVSKTFYAIIFAGIFSLVITLIVSIVTQRKFWFSNKIAISRDTIRQILKYGIPFAPACLMSILFEGIDKMFLRTYIGFEDIGLYSAACRIVAILAIVQGGFSTFWTPVSFEHYEKHPNDTSFYEQAYRYLLFVLPLLGLLLIGAKDIIILIFAKNYINAASLMPFLVFIPVMYTLTEITCLGIYFKKKSVWQLIVFGILLVMSFSFNFVLVPLFGAKGAALAVALSYTAYFFIRTAASIRLYPMNFHLVKTMFVFLLLYIVAGINTFIANKIIGISCVGLAILIYMLFHMSIVKDIIAYFRQAVVKN
jgi:O-antigen/teichoic acid export membrane protein